jgi:glucosamine 6-phosphate synthetase-like amidotransferase/phosphosugar isomerase protein
MCGQFGIMTGGRELYADDFIKDAFTASMLRGIDSSGVALVDPESARYVVHKLPVPGNFFVGDRVAEAIIKDACSPKTLTMCHVRAATVGKVTLSNAHPFEVTSSLRTVVGTHNGTLRGWQSKTGASSYSVDSEWALSRIAAEGADAFEEITGAWAFAWWQSDDPTVLNLARNDERPLCVAFIENNGMAYASEPGMLFWLLERNRIKMEGKIIQLDKGKHYKFELNDPKNFTSTVLPTPPATTTSAYTGGMYSYGHSYSYTVVDKVEDMLKLLTGAGTAETEVTELTTQRESEYAENFPLVFESEIQTAREYGWLNEDAEFDVHGVNSAGNTVGTADVGGYEFDAFIRGDYSHMPEDHVWKCKVIGVDDDSRTVVLILGKPYKTEAWDEAEEEEEA